MEVGKVVVKTSKLFNRRRRGVHFNAKLIRFDKFHSALRHHHRRHHHHHHHYTVTILKTNVLIEILKINAIDCRYCR